MCLVAEGHLLIPFQVRDGAFLSRQAARGLLRRLRGRGPAEAASTVEAAARDEGLAEETADEVGEQEATRQADLARLVRLARELDDGGRTVGEFVADLQSRFASDGEGRGINLLTYHRAKGLEFDAVFLPHLEEGELPFKRVRSAESLAEERRLLYVGITRAKTHVVITWSFAGRKPSRFLAELGVGPEPGDGAPARRPSKADLPPELVALKKWRLERARAGNIAAYIVFHDSVLEQIASRKPKDWADLAAIDGVGPVKLERYGDEVLGVLRRYN